jgi:hypothetical protein
MPVYVDMACNNFRRMVMCHMIADTPAELHDMAERIGMRREWFQPTSFPHYDVAKGRREQAVRLGAIECSRREFMAHLKRIRECGLF